MGHLPRLHPDDLKELTENISKNLKTEMNLLYSKEDSISKTQVFTVEETAKILNKSVSTILRYLKGRTLIGTKPGKDWIITQQNLDNHINGNQ